MAEKGRIARFFAPLTAGEQGAFNLTDDAAILNVPAGHQLVITTDSVIESIHVLADATAQQFAQKLVRRNLSDLAAMGTKPWRYSLNIHTPHHVGDDWFVEFAATLAAEQKAFDMVLIGGDSTSGGHAIHTTLTCFGLLKTGTGLRRNSAQAGDDLYVSGTIGDAALALQLLQQNGSAPQSFFNRYHRPEPRLNLGLALHGLASAAIDISDGLVADVHALCAASGVGATLETLRIPLSPMLQQLVENDAPIWDLILTGGDDYELAFTAPETSRAALQQLSAKLDLALTRIGHITEEKEVRVVDKSGTIIPITHGGWEHG